MQARTRAASARPAAGCAQDAIGGSELALLHKAYVTSIKQHRALMGDLCATLERLADVLEAADLDHSARSAISAGIDRHVDQARAIVAEIDQALTSAALTRPSAQH
jgi:hypothetical protein